MADPTEEETIVQEFNQLRHDFSSWFREHKDAIKVPALLNDFQVLLEMLKVYEEILAKELGV